MHEKTRRSGWYVVQVTPGAEDRMCNVITRACSELLAVVIPIVSGSNVIGRQYLIPTFRDNLYTVTVACGAVVNVVLIVLLAPGYGAFGAAVATVGAETAVLIAQGIAARRELPLVRYMTNALPFVLIGLAMAITVRLAASWFGSMWGMSVHGLALEVLLGGVLYIFLAGAYCFITRNEHFFRIFASFGVDRLKR